MAGSVGRRYVICYDICHNRRRYRVDKALKGWGERVQRSVFEAILTQKELGNIIRELGPLIDETVDSIRIYPVEMMDKQLCLGVDAAYISNESIVVF